MGVLVALALGRFSEAQAQPHQILLWNDFGAVTLALPFVTTAIWSCSK
jgi:hypothetical protein